MSVKSGAIQFEGGAWKFDRLQTAGPANINVPRETVYEIGNFNSVGRTTDVPDLSFDLESLDMTSELEAVITRFADPGTIPDGTEFDFNDAKPFDVISPWKATNNSEMSGAGVIIPYLTLENVTYRFGVRASATFQGTLRGDAIYLSKNTPYWAKYTVSGAGPYAFTVGTTPAISTVESGETIFALCVTAFLANGSYVRLDHGSEYTDTASGFTLTAAGLAKAPNGSELEVVWFSATTRSLAGYPSSSVKPAAVRAPQIDVYVSDGAATPTFIRWANIQTIEASRRVTIDRDEELGSAHATAADYDVPEVSGTLTMRPSTASYLIDIIAQSTGVSATSVINVLSLATLEMEIRVEDEDGDRLKTIYIPDAQFTVPGIQTRVRSKQEVQIPFASESGQMLVYAGERP